LGFLWLVYKRLPVLRNGIKSAIHELVIYLGKDPLLHHYDLGGVMIDTLTPHLLTLIYDAALKSFWRKNALRKFLRQCRLSENFLATWNSDESKRDFLDRAFTELQKTDKGRKAILQMAAYLAEQDSFPDLENWEDSKEKIQDAAASVGRLRDYNKSKKARSSSGLITRKLKEGTENIKQRLSVHK